MLSVAGGVCFIMWVVTWRARTHRWLLKSIQNGCSACVIEVAIRKFLLANGSECTLPSDRQCIPPSDIARERSSTGGNMVTLHDTPTLGQSPQWSVQAPPNTEHDQVGCARQWVNHTQAIPALPELAVLRCVDAICPGFKSSSLVIIINPVRHPVPRGVGYPEN